MRRRPVSTSASERRGAGQLGVSSIAPAMLLTLVFSVVAAPTWSHDMWIQPTRFEPAVGEVVALGLWIGHLEEAEAFPRRDDHLLRFEAVLDGQTTTLAGRPGHRPAGYLKADSPGLHALVYESSGADSELPPARFDQYLLEEGLESVRAWRRDHGEEERPGRERYSRSLKSLVWVGGGKPDSRDEPVGLPLELILETPLVVGSGPPRVRLMWHGKPLAGAKVDLESLDDVDVDDRTIRSGRTDHEGRVRFAAIGSGTWMLATIHMERAAPAAEGWDWRTTFATLTFFVAGATDSSS